MSRALIHGHTCLDCGHLVTCLVPNCEIRATKHEGSFTCGCETPATMPASLADRRVEPEAEAA